MTSHEIEFWQIDTISKLLCHIGKGYHDDGLETYNGKHRDLLEDSEALVYRGTFAIGNEIIAELREQLQGLELAVSVLPASRISKLLGKRIGGGQFRTAYQHCEDANLVVKTGNAKQNLREARIYQNSESKHLAPVVAVSECGEYLVMRKTNRIPAKNDDLMFRMVEISQAYGDLDMNPSNYGLLDGNVVCHDYGGMN